MLYDPPAFSRRALASLRDVVPDDQLIEATAEDAAAFCMTLRLDLARA